MTINSNLGANLNDDYAAGPLEDELDPDGVCAGLICPRCHKAVMQYNGLLELTCPKCGFRAPGAAFT